MTWPVGSLKPNDFGLFDVQGNVYTWCQESYEPYPTMKGDAVAEDREDVELIPKTTMRRVLRGGSYSSPLSHVRSANRINYVPRGVFVNPGFRVARTLAP
jgi:formylglycine-generating enzyme required for sulfatase activity